MPCYQNITWGCFGVGWRNKASEVDNFSCCEDKRGSHSHRVGSFGISTHLILHCFLWNKVGILKSEHLLTLVTQLLKGQSSPPILYQAELVLAHNVPGSSEFSLRPLFIFCFLTRKTEMLGCFLKLISTLENKVYYVQNLLHNSLNLSGSCIFIWK